MSRRLESACAGPAGQPSRLNRPETLGPRVLFTGAGRSHMTNKSEPQAVPAPVPHDADLRDAVQKALEAHEKYGSDSVEFARQKMELDHLKFQLIQIEGERKADNTRKRKIERFEAAEREAVAAKERARDQERSADAADGSAAAAFRWKMKDGATLPAKYGRLVFKVIQERWPDDIPEHIGLPHRNDLIRAEAKKKEPSLAFTCPSDSTIKRVFSAIEFIPPK
jgi:hypothetical protein